MNKEQKTDASNSKKVDKVKENKDINKDHEDYGYDFVPTLDEWLNIDEQKERTEELEDMSD